jgi:hypothetical protein
MGRRRRKGVEKITGEMMERERGSTKVWGE